MPSPSATPSAPPSKAAERMEEIFKLFESSDYSSISSLVQGSFTREFIASHGENDFMSYLADTVRRSGGIHRGKILENGNQATAFFRSNLTERWGAIMLTVMWFRCAKGHFTRDNHFAFEAVAWYWHFVDVVWLGLFLFVYVL